jgi:branched-chain amino acid transport system permease protein
MTGSFWVGLVLAPILTGIFGVIVEKVFIRGITASGHLGQLILTLGLSMVILGLVKVFWGTQSLPMQVPEILQGMVNLGGLEYPIYRLFIIGMSLTVLVLMVLLLFKTRLGKIVRAAVSDRDMVNALGINIPLVFMLVFGVGCWLAGIAGVAIAPILTVFPGLADQVGMDAFIVVCTGGFGSLAGAFVVSIIFGLLSSYGVQFLSQLAPVLMVIFMAVVLAIRPNGLFGVKE